MLVGISYDEVGLLKRFSDQNEIEFQLLSDSKSKAIRNYQLFDDREQGKYRGVPVPHTIVVDRAKKIRLVIPGSIQKRHSGEELSRRISGL